MERASPHRHAGAGGAHSRGGQGRSPSAASAAAPSGLRRDDFTAAGSPTHGLGDGAAPMVTAAFWNAAASLVLYDGRDPEHVTLVAAAAATTQHRCQGQLPSRRHGYTAVVANDGLVVFGGSRGGGLLCDAEVHRLDLVTMTWALLWPPPTSSSHAGDVVVGGRLVHRSVSLASATLTADHHTVRGGGDSDRFLDDGHSGGSYDPPLNHYPSPPRHYHDAVVDAPAPSPRVFHVAVAVGNTMFVHGGSHEQSTVRQWRTAVDLGFFDMFAFDLVGKRWLSSAPGHPMLSHHSAAATADQRYLVLFGGLSCRLDISRDVDSLPSAEPSNRVYIFDIGAFSWAHVFDLNPSPRERFSAPCAVALTEFFVLGGVTLDDATTAPRVTHDLWSWDFRGRSWRRHELPVVPDSARDGPGFIFSVEDVPAQPYEGSPPASPFTAVASPPVMSSRAAAPLVRTPPLPLVTALQSSPSSSSLRPPWIMGHQRPLVPPPDSIPPSATTFAAVASRSAVSSPPRHIGTEPLRHAVVPPELRRRNGASPTRGRRELTSAWYVTVTWDFATFYKLDVHRKHLGWTTTRVLPGATRLFDMHSPQDGTTPERGNSPAPQIGIDRGDEHDPRLSEQEEEEAAAGGQPLRRRELNSAADDSSGVAVPSTVPSRGGHRGHHGGWNAFISTAAARKGLSAADASPLRAESHATTVASNSSGSGGATSSVSPERTEELLRQRPNVVGAVDGNDAMRLLPSFRR